MRRQQQRKNYQGRIRSASGQTTLQSFLFKSRVDGDVRPSVTPEAGREEEVPVCPPEPPKREIVRVSKATIKEKASAFSSVGSSSVKNEDGEARGALSAAVFKGFHGSAPAARAEDSVTGDGEKAVEDDDGCGVRFDIGDTETRSSREPWKKRKSPLGDGHEEHGSSAKTRRVVVLGDDPRPRPRRMPGRPRSTRGGSQGEGGRALYNHYASGGGWWHSDMEGVDGEEIGWTDDMWEGMGSVTLGGLEWH
ncbi:hypothetical protein PR202_ga00496 [Eleusine coracana subsp. coracana]|uniref:Uncharacterized protein n=1 Tax=Eleusine coracana subsp. coracana TaxID=191504 RepID=A0AAV5BGN1_ELECO|nr:hypothetical protein PR202_ga00496 [Eleusine coracana subsp. coracana]